MKTTAEKRDVMTAYLQGAKIECLLVDHPKDVWDRIDKPIWNWDAFDYRVKPEPKLRPWKPEEAIGKVVRNKINGDLTIVMGVRRSHSVCHFWGQISLAELLDQFVQPDGSPCGAVE